MADDKYFQDEYIDIDFLPEEEYESVEDLSIEEINKIIDKQFNDIWEPAIKCDCGAEKARTTHSHWCSKYVK